MINLINELNKNDFRAFPQKADPTKVTLSVLNPADGQRYFLTRVSTGINPEDGTPIYAWARGNAMRPQQAPAAGNQAPAANPVA